MVRWSVGVDKLAEKKEKEEDEDVWMQRGDGLKPRALQWDYITAVCSAEAPLPPRRRSPSIQDPTSLGAL